MFTDDRKTDVRLDISPEDYCRHRPAAPVERPDSAREKEPQPVSTPGTRRPSRAGIVADARLRCSAPWPRAASVSMTRSWTCCWRRDGAKSDEAGASSCGRPARSDGSRRDVTLSQTFSMEGL
jgi:hypothetical protein